MFRILGLIAAIVGVSITARADELVMPPGSRIGLVPPPGFSVARTFAGFQNVSANASIVFAEFPAGEFDQFRRGVSADGLAQKGLRLTSRETIDGFPYEAITVRAEQRVGDVLFDKWLTFFDAKILVGMVAVSIPKVSRPRLEDAVIRAALASVKVRSDPPGDAVAALPFAVEPAARFKFRMPLAGRGLLLKETPPPPEGQPDDIALTIVLAADPTIAPADQQSFGEQQFLAMRSITDQSIESTKPLRVGEIAGFEYLARGKSAKTGQPLRILFVVLYPAGRPFVLMGLASPARFDEALPDFRAVIGSFRPKV